MAETIVKTEVCPACKADVREGALFCYHCGGALSEEVAVSATNGDSVSSGWFRENITDDAKIKEAEKSKDTSKLDEVIVEKIDTPIAKPLDEPLEKPIEKPLNEPIEKPNPVEDTKLKSAATMRRKAKIVQKKRVEEVVWEEHENAPNAWFIIVALILILLAATLFFLAVYMK